MARPKRGVRASWLPLHPSTSRTEESLQANATALRPSAGIVKENDNRVSVGNSTAPVVQGLERRPRTQPPAVQVKTEPICSPALGEKLSLRTPISATVSSTFPGAERLQAIAPAIRPCTRPAKEKRGYGRPQRQTTIPEFYPQVKRESRAKTKEKRSPASASTSTATVVKVEGVDAGTGSVMPSSGDDGQGASVSEKRKGKRKAYIMSNKPRVARGFKLTRAELKSDAHMLLEDKAEKLGVSKAFFKRRRREAGLGRWPGRKVRAQIKRAQAQAHA